MFEDTRCEQGDGDLNPSDDLFVIHNLMKFSDSFLFSQDHCSFGGLLEINYKYIN